MKEHQDGYPNLKKCRKLIKDVVKEEERLAEKPAQALEEEMCGDASD